jgi:uncharacterized protein (DUF2236 family)
MKPLGSSGGWALVGPEGSAPRAVHAGQPTRTSRAMTQTSTQEALATDGALEMSDALGPDSLIWRYFGDARVVLFLGGGSLLQVAHPVVGKGVGDHSTFKVDPHGRLMRSIELLWPVVYNTPTGVREQGRRLREMHRNIKGTGYDDKPYHALQIEPYLWVHITAFAGFLSVAEFVGDELTDTQRRQLFREWRQMGRQMGVRNQDMPTDIASYWNYVQEMIANRLDRNETFDFINNKKYFVERPMPPGWPLSELAWEQIRKPLGGLVWLCGRSSMPQSFRQKFDIPWTFSDRCQIRIVSKALQMIWPLLPERARWLPPAYKAICEYREHPERFAPERRA